ncbi:hypothetical protein Clacol_004212 [Clathrus columnatus]|uniref:Protein kinase domain-containing protein n=1 Tax=Clathrus columnatus TaxID=1419009 RepID=A0AAV5AAE4_9AGAM|nr:hypothetical protein Clacol_004212 [Clathrus columnatus]
MSRFFVLLPNFHHLETSIFLLGERIGSGRVGTVYAAILLTEDYTSVLPPLVVKISRRKHSMEKEAWFYEELEQLQGIAVPLCYGFFQTRVEEGVEVSTWNDKNHVEQEEVDEWGFPVIKKEPEDPTLLSILLLERLGWNIPLGYRDFDYSYIKADVYEIYSDLALVGIEHVDFRWSNILCVLECPEDGPSEPVCPNHGHAHAWRIIDLDLARKTNLTIKGLENCIESHLRRLFNNAPWGIVLEPWE